MIGILDYGVGNISAFLRIYHSHNIDAISIKTSNDFEKINKIILPGVGSFDAAMCKFKSSGLRESLDHNVLNNKMPLLGVCIGMHMIGNSSEEGYEKGLGYIDGVTKKITNIENKDHFLVPHMGWNSIETSRDDLIWNGVNKKEGFYFLHSYYFKPKREDLIIGTSNYHKNFACAVKSGHIYGFQFHPEKSLSNGIKLLVNFATA